MDSSPENEKKVNGTNESFSGSDVTNPSDLGTDDSGDFGFGYPNATREYIVTMMWESTQIRKQPVSRFPQRFQARNAARGTDSNDDPRIVGTPRPRALEFTPNGSPSPSGPDPAPASSNKASMSPIIPVIESSSDSLYDATPPLSPMTVGPGGATFTTSTPENKDYALLSSWPSLSNFETGKLTSIRLVVTQDKSGDVKAQMEPDRTIPTPAGNMSLDTIEEESDDDDE